MEIAIQDVQVETLRQALKENQQSLIEKLTTCGSKREYFFERGGGVSETAWGGGDGNCDSGCTGRNIKAGVEGKPAIFIREINHLGSKEKRECFFESGL